MSNKEWVWAIVGSFQDSSGDVLFGGFLKLNSQGGFEGETVDAFGKARIYGKLTTDRLVFRKGYGLGSAGTVPKKEIQYSLEPKEDNAFEGLYLLETGKNGKVSCRLFKAFEASWSHIGPAVVY